MKTIKQTYIINASLQEVWKALTDSKYIDAWGAGPAKMDSKVGTKFSLWGGEIWGENKEVVVGKKLVQHWWSKEDKFDKASLAIFELFEENGKTRLELTHADVPDQSAKDIDDGWRSFYLGPLKDYLELKN